MADEQVAPGTSAQQIAETITERLRATQGDAPGQDQAAPSGDDAITPEQDDGEEQTLADDTGQVQETEPPIDPPASWAKDAKEAFLALPRDLQQTVAERERERTADLHRRQSAADKARQDAEAAAQTIAAERQRYANYLASLQQQMVTLDPVIAEGQKTDWDKLAVDDPAEWARRKQAFESRVNHIQMLEAERRRVEQVSFQERSAKMVQTLKADIPELADEKSWNKFNSEISAYLVKEGFAPEAISSETNPLLIKQARKAMLYDKLMAEKAKIEQKKQPAAAPRALRPGATVEGNGSDPRFDAAKKAAIRSGNPRLMAEVALARLRAHPTPR